MFMHHVLFAVFVQCDCVFAGTRPEEALARILGAKMAHDTALQEGSLQKKHRQK